MAAYTISIAVVAAGKCVDRLRMSNGEGEGDARVAIDVAKQDFELILKRSNFGLSYNEIMRLREGYALLRRIVDDLGRFMDGEGSDPSKKGPGK